MSDRVNQLKEMLLQSPKDNFLHHALALEYVKIGADIDAKKHFEENKNNNPEYVATYYHLGKLLERNGHLHGASNIYRMGMEVAKAQNDNHTYSELQAAYEDLEEE